MTFKKLVVILLITFSNVSLYGQQNAVIKSKVTKLYSSSHKFFQDKEYDSAIRDLTEIIRLSPNEKAAHLYMALCYSDQGQYNSAIKCFNSALQIDSGYEAALSGRGFAYYDLEQYDLATKDFTSAIRVKPSKASNYSIRGNIYSIQKKYELAIKDFTKAVELDPDNEDYKNSLANAQNKSTNSNVSNNEAEVVEAKKISLNTFEINSYTNSTNLKIKKGDKVSISATGSIVLGAWAGSGGPDGINGYTSYNRVQGFRHGSLLVRVGKDSEWEFVGDSKTFTSQSNGILELLVNDGDPSNNSGAFTVVIKINGK